MQAINKVISSLITIIAQSMDRKGKYTLQTYKLYCLAKYINATQKTIFDYLAFQRKLGIPLTVLQSQCIDWDTFSKKQQRRLIEYHFDSCLENFISRKDLIEIVDRYSLIVSRQFRIYEEISRKKNFCIVGNSRSILANTSGSEIDALDFVVRFNDYKIIPEKTGTKTSMHAISPGLFQCRQKNNSLLFISSPNYIYRAYEYVDIFSGLNIIGTPLMLWNALVKALQRPPSVGILTIALIRTLANRNAKIFVTGFSFDNVHINCDNVPCNRHNWKLEKKIFDNFVQNGVIHILSDNSR